MCECPILFLCIDVANISNRVVVEKILKVSIDAQIKNYNQLLKVSYSYKVDKVLFLIKKRHLATSR